MVSFQDAMLDLAYISPLNPMPNGLSDYSEMLIPALAEQARLTLYSDCGAPSNPIIAGRFAIRPVEQLARHRAEHDLRLYQLGNSSDHRHAFDAFRQMPGVVTLHEPFLHHAFYGISQAYYVREAAYDLGVADRARFGRMLRRVLGDDRLALMPVLLIGRLIDSGLGLIVHSRAARRAIESYRRGRLRQPEIAVIPHVMPLEAECAPQVHRAEFDLPLDALVFGVAGSIHRTKEPALVVQAFARIAGSMPSARLIFIGEAEARDDLSRLAGDLGVAEAVMFSGRLDPIQRLHRAMAACDVLINLRQPTIGETSGTALRALSLGRSLIVRDAGWYGELPDDACVKLPPATGAPELASLMLSLGAAPDARHRLSEAARRYIQTECAPAIVAGRYADFLREALAIHRHVERNAGPV